MPVSSMKLNVVTRKMVKPFTQTPINLKNHNLSFIDQLAPPLNIGIILFYQTSIPKPNHLEQSLAKILPQFYPLAGRYVKENHLVDCCDQGAEFVEAEAFDVKLADLVAKMETDQLNDLLPSQFYRVDESPVDPLLSIRVTEFKSCGGVAISVTVSHRVFDASSLGTFIAVWSNHVYNPERSVTISPTFDSLNSLFPCKNYECFFVPSPSRGGLAMDINPGIACKRFSFNKKAITRLKLKFASVDSKPISRVRLVSAVISKALIGMDEAKHGKLRAFVIFQAVNMRGRTVPPLPKHSCGNLVMGSVTSTENIAKNIGIEEVVDILGDGIAKAIADCGEMFYHGVDRHRIIMDSMANFIEKSMSGEVNAMLFSDWSKFGFYEADLGWGKPVGVGVGARAGEKMILLMNNKVGDGLDVWVSLNGDDMTYFEQDEDIKSFTS